MNLQQMILEVRRAVNEITADFWSDAEITDYLNEGAKIMCAEAQPLQAFFQQTLTAGTQEYVLPEDFDEVYSVALYHSANIYQLKPTSPEAAQFGNRIQSIPEYFYIRKQVAATAGQQSDGSIAVAAINDNPNAGKSVLGLWAIPNAADVLTVFYFSRHFQMRLPSDVSPIPTEYHRGPVAYAIAMCKQKDEAYGEMNTIYLPMFQQFTDKLKRKMASRGQAMEFPKVKVLGENDYSGNSSVIFLPNQVS